MRIRAFLAVLALASLTALASLAHPARADEPANVTYSPLPPGTVVQNLLVYIAGEAMHSQWHAVTSKKQVGTYADKPFYQWYLSIYEINGSTYELKYQSPKNGPPLSAVSHSSDGKMWFPTQSISIAGQAELMQSGVQQLVVQSHETGADCGTALVTILGTNRAGSIFPEVSVQNACDLDAKIVRPASGGLASIQLTGPYYAANAALCCPTKTSATATLTYANGKWTQNPHYFTVYPGKFPPQ
ncbi:MAG: hypothetical protein ACLQPV_10845 [Vulcanimicrobiaceae bacterium]